MDITVINFYSKEGSITSNSYRSQKKLDQGYIEFGIASGFISTTEVLFVAEGITARIEASGNVEFLNDDRQLLATVSAPSCGDRYRDVSCKVEGDQILIRFPRYKWVDNYPHCDGESDRWDSFVCGYQQPIAFSMTTHQVTILNG